MVNIGAGWHTLIAIMLIAGGAGLYFLRSFRPALARDHDIFFAAVGLLCGGILFFQGWRLDPILQFGQFMLTGSAIFFAFESIRLRGIATEQAKREMPIVDEDRPVSRVYRAELDELEFEERPSNRRIRGRKDNMQSAYDEDDYYTDSSRRRPRRSTRVERLEPAEERPRRRRSRPEEQLPAAESRSRSQDARRDEDRSTRRRRNSRAEASAYPNEPSSYSDDFSSDDNPPRPRRRRSAPSTNPTQSSRDRNRLDSGDAYVDYQPLPRLDEDDDDAPDPIET